MFCIGDLIGGLQFIGDCIGCCIPDGDLSVAKLGEGTEATGDLSGPNGTGLRMGPGLELGMLGLLWIDAGLRTWCGLIGDVLDPIGPILGYPM